MTQCLIFIYFIFILHYIAHVNITYKKVIKTNSYVIAQQPNNDKAITHKGNTQRLFFFVHTNACEERHIHTQKQICVGKHIIDRLWDEQRNPECVVKGHQEVVHCQHPAGCLGFGGLMVWGAPMLLTASPENFLFPLEGKSSLCNCI